MATLADIVRTLDLVTAPTDVFKERTTRLGPETADPLEHLRSVLRDRNTIGVGVGYKITAKRVTDAVALQVYVEKKRKSTELKAAEAAPETAVALDGEPIATDVIEVGRVVPEILAQRKPLQPGPSIGRADQNAAGTFGAVVTKGGRHYILSNSHVLAKSGKGKKGDRIVYPSRLDGGKLPGDVVGKLAAFKKFIVGGKYVNTVDAAIASVDPARSKDLRSEIKNLGVPRGTITRKQLDKMLGAQVTKTGRTTGTKGGKIIGLSARIKITYPGVGTVGFTDQVLCTRYSDGGDSGSLVLERKTKKAVGLHFAGAKGKSSYFTPFDHVHRALGVRLVTTPIGSKGGKASRRRKR